VPDELRELVVSKSEGNPFYVEELLKMLIEDSVILQGAERWQVNPTRLAEVRVPPTLTAVLQARFDGLPAREKLTLQRASVLGRTFWAEAVDFMDNAEEAMLADTLAALAVLRGREMIFQHEVSTFAATAEYSFKHTLLRDAIYESVLKRERRAYHARAAEWLQVNCGAREGEFVGLIAEHLERAAQAEQAAQYLARAGASALGTYAYREAVDYFARALALLPPESRERIPLLVQSGEALWYLGEYAQAQAQLQAGLTLGQQHGEDGHYADALIHLGSIARKQGDWAKARAYLDESLKLARRLGDRSKIAHALHSLAWVDIRQGAYPSAKLQFAESRALYQDLGNLQGLADTLNGLGTVTLNLGEYEEARAFYQASLTLFQKVQDRPGESATLVNLGEIARRQGDYAAAWQYYEKALAVDREIGDGLLAAITLGNLGHTALACGDYSAAEGYYREGLQTALSIGAVPDVLDSLSGMAGVLAHTNKQDLALEVLGLVLHHPALDDESRPIAAQALAELRTALPTNEIESGLARGAARPLAELVTEILAST
jgi:tetratricopeptide (TPR) repeat protein